MLNLANIMSLQPPTGTIVEIAGKFLRRYFNHCWWRWRKLCWLTRQNFVIEMW